MPVDVEKLIAELTLEEKTRLVGGADGWRTAAVARLGIPALKMTDGPNGARGSSFAGSVRSALFPCGAALAATWSPALVERVGRALADEVKAKGAHVLLGPTVNLHRTPTGGRNFECYSEDPMLSGALATAFVRGVQAGGVGACLKHFVCNDCELERHTVSVRVDERVLRELYLVPFEMAVRDARPWAVMAAYNRINAIHASEHGELLQRVLKDEWGFDGYVVSDWYGTNDTVGIARGGLDLEMPGPPRHTGSALLEAIEGGRLPDDVLDDKVRRILRTLERAGVFAAPEEPQERSSDPDACRALTREVAGEAIVLLQNEREVLPLDGDGMRTLALVGPNAVRPVCQGGGSASVTPHYEVSIEAALRERLGPGLELRLAAGCESHKRIPRLDPRRVRTPDGEAGLQLTFVNGDDPGGEPVLKQTTRRTENIWFGPIAPEVNRKLYCARFEGVLSADATGPWTFALVSAGLSRLSIDGREVVDNWSAQTPGESFFGTGSSEVRGSIELEAGREYRLVVDFHKTAEAAGAIRIGCLPPLPGDAFERAVDAARTSDAAVVVLGLNDDWESEGYDRADMALPGRQAELARAVAAVNPNTVVVVNAGSPVELDFADEVPAVLWLWYPGQECGHALCDVLFGERDPGGRLPTTFPRRLEDTPAFLSYPGEQGELVYSEGVFAGYRYYDARRVAPRFCFGHGLSYADFRYGAPRLARERVHEGEPVEVEVEVENASARAGTEVVQLYVRDPEASVRRPDKELKAFEKLHLGPGERRTVRFALSPRDLSFYDTARRAWVAEPGRFEVLVGRSSGDVRGRASFELVV